MGTIANEMRKLPGATFSNVRQRPNMILRSMRPLTLEGT